MSARWPRRSVQRVVAQTCLLVGTCADLGVERDHPTDGVAATFVVERGDSGQACVTPREGRIVRLDVHGRWVAARQARLVEEPMQRILEGRNAAVVGKTERRRDRPCECLGVGIGTVAGSMARFGCVHAVGQELSVVPERFAVGAP